MVSVIEWLDALLPLALAHLCWVGSLEKPRRQLHQPLGIDNRDLTHVLLRRHHELVIDDPVWLSLEQSAAWMDVNWLVLDQCPVALLRILSSRMEEEPRRDRLPYLCKILAGAHHI